MSDSDIAPARSRNSAPAHQRIAYIDVLRGVALVLLVLEAARQYFHGAIYRFEPLDVMQTTPAIYATKWITHLAAPILALLAGASVHFRRLAGASNPALSRYLAVRGIWLVVLELTVVAVGRDFALPPPILFAALGAIGCAMLALAVLIWLPRRVVLGLGVAALLGGGVLDHIHAWQFGPLALLWDILYEPLLLVSDGRLRAIVDYAVIPWTAIAFIGYGLGPVFAGEPKRRDRILLALGAALVVAFLALRALNHGDPQDWSVQADVARTVMSFLNVEKFPPSLMYACVTLGFIFLLTPLIARLTGPVAAFLRTLGGVPLFAYVTHFYVVHTLALVALLATGGNLAATFDAIGKLSTSPREYIGSGFGLPMVYLAWVVALALLYPLCRWWAAIKRARRDWRLSYL